MENAATPLGLEFLFVEVFISAPETPKKIETAARNLGLVGWQLDEVRERPGNKVEAGLRPPAGWPDQPGEAAVIREAWKAAHALAAELGGETHVEPVFMGDLSVPKTNRGEESAIFGDRPESKVNWHLERARVTEAHGWLKARGLSLGGSVRIGHPDTGYTRHVELGTDGTGALDTQHQHNLLDGENERDATDKGDDGFLEFPYHGTATASVMIARPDVSTVAASDGRQINLVGVAPDAKLAPIRVTKTVIVFGWQSRLARAIDRAVADGCRVISISLGGLGGSYLDRAIERAVSQGVIIVAAAGNYFPFVVAPARHPDVIACAAAGPDDRPWIYSASGNAVAITAPGHDVWVAGWQTGQRAVARTGDGTSFATACVAGAAALWLEVHERALSERRDKSTIPRLFRDALRRSARKFGEGYEEGGFGAGHLDVAKLLETAPRPEGQLESAPLEPLSPVTCSLEALLDLGTRSTRANARARVEKVTEGLEAGELAELAFHLTVDREARAAWRHASTGLEAVDLGTRPIPLRASPRLRAALERRAGAKEPTPPEPTPPEPPAPSPAPKRAPGKADANVVARVRVVVDITVRVDVEGS